MKYYTDELGEVFAYEEDGSQDHLVGNKTPITKQEADALGELWRQRQFNGLSYDEKRKREYPPIADYLDGIVKGDQAQVTAYIEDCLAVKAKYPKP